jgi:hypothetical protein
MRVRRLAGVVLGLVALGVGVGFLMGLVRPRGGR